MRRSPKRLLAGVVLCLFLLPLGQPIPPRPARALAEAPPITEPAPEVWSAVESAVEKGEPLIDLALATPDAAGAAAVAAQVRAAGGEVVDQAETYLQVRVDPAKVNGLIQATPGLAVSTNRRISASLSESAVANLPLLRQEAAASAAENFAAIGLSAFRAAWGTTGEGVKVAVIDSGIDPGHPDLRTTAGGRAKLVDWKDFTREGWIALTETVAWTGPYTAPDGRTFGLPPRPAASAAARFGYWDEGKVPGLINKDLDRNGSPLDRFGVLAVDSQQTGVYDLVYVDTNHDGDFADEQPLRLFQNGGGFARLGRNRYGDAAVAQLAVVLADLDPAGDWVSLGFDSLGHGTQVAGVLAANGSDGFVGVAPGTQLMALKVVTSQNEGNWFAIHNAVRYAAEQGAAIINISLGGLPVASRYDSAAAARLNEIAAAYNVLIVLAVDNTGPGLSSGSSLGSPWEIMAVGAYYSPAMWRRDYGYVVPKEGVWWHSGMGPRADGAYLPSLIAPGGSPSTSPHWLHVTGYTTAIGTSIAAPHVAGAAALLIEGTRQSGLVADHRSLRRALEESARPLADFAAYEQGHGLLDLPAARGKLHQGRPAAALAGRTGLEGEGLLARTYRPGNGAFYLTNRSAEAARVAVTSSAEWVSPVFTSLLLPPWEERQLPLRFAPPKEPGVHAAYLRLTPEGAGGATTLPVTYVKPVELERGRFSTTAELEVARYQRYFVEVKPGAGQLTLNARSQLAASGLALGRFRVQLFRPDGQLLFQSHPVGVGSDGLATSHVASGPMPGLWEVVVTALPDAEGLHLQAGFSLDLAVSNPPVGIPRRYAVAPGEVVNVDLPVFNPGSAIQAQVKVVGLTPANEGQLLEMKGELNLIDEFVLPIRAGSLLLESAAVGDFGSDLNLWLYRLDPAKGWVPYWWGASRRPGGERMELFDVPEGRYQVYMAYSGSRPPGLRYQYQRSIALDGKHLSAPSDTHRREPGQQWTVPMNIIAPTVPGRYYGYALVIDTDTGESVTWLPIEVSVGQPELSIQPLFSQLRPGQPGTVVLEMRDSTTGRLVDGPVLVNGQRYTTRQGQVAVPVFPWESVQSLQVEVNLPSHRPFQGTIQVPAHQSWSPDLGSGGPEGDSGPWRQRVESFLR